MDIVTIQSRVTWGYVGNAVAVPTLQALGMNAWPVDTVRLGHHPGHGIPAKHVTEVEELKALLSDALNKTQTPACVLMGYLGSADQGHAAVQIINHQRGLNNDTSLYLDPAFGDDPGGTYVAASIVDFYRTEAIQAANFIMPNRYELSTLSGREITSVLDAVNAAHTLISSGCKSVMASSIPAPDGTLANIFVDNDTTHICTSARMTIGIKGTGDLLSAAFCGLHANGHTAEESLARASAIVQTACIHASKNNLTELNLIDLLGEIHDGISPLPVIQHT